MDDSHARSTSATFERAPEITKATEFHTQETVQAKKTSQRMLVVAICAVSLGVFGCISLYLIETNDHILKRGPLILFSYILIKSMMVFAAHDLFLNFMMIVCTVVRSTWPENIFIGSLFSRLTRELSLLMLLLFSYWIPSYGEVISRSSRGTDLFYWIMGIDRFSGSSGFERNLIQGLIIFVQITILRDTIIFGLNFNVHYRYYVDRIRRNSEKVGILQAMNEVINAGYTGDVDVIVQRLIQVMSKDGSVITRSDLLPFFGESTSDKIMELCSSDGGEEITMEEIKGFYIYTMLEQQKIVKSLEQNDESVQNFRKILNVVFVPIACFYFIGNPILENMHSHSLLLTWNLDSSLLGALLFSTSYTFSDNIKAFLNSLNFIFFIRPYEVEDIIILNYKAYKVHAINLLTTVLLEESKYTVFPNSFLATQPITNLRLRKIWDEHFAFDFNLEEFEAKKDEFLMRLVGYTRKRSSEFRKNPYFSSITIKQENKVNACLVVGFNLDVSDLNVIQERKNRFLFILNGMLRECDLVPYKN